MGNVRQPSSLMRAGSKKGILRLECYSGYGIVGMEMEDMTSNSAKSQKRFRMRPPVLDLVTEVLKEAGKPMHYRQIMQEVVRRQPYGGKKPNKTFYSTLYRSRRVKLVGEGFFALADTRTKK